MGVGKNNYSDPGFRVLSFNERPLERRTFGTFYGPCYRGSGAHGAEENNQACERESPAFTRAKDSDFHIFLFLPSGIGTGPAYNLCLIVSGRNSPA